MPFIPHTPESLIQRSDSKNPAATCSGLTASGRPCRRAVAQALQAVPRNGLRPYCWQHREQAEQSGHAGPPAMQTLRERTSTDTLVDRLGLLSVNGEGRRRKNHTGQEPQPGQRLGTKPDIQRPKRKQTSSSTFWCCFAVSEERPIAPRPTAKQHVTASARPQRASVPEMTQSGTRPATLSRPKIPRDPSSNTTALLKLIPQNTSPQTAALLLSELTKPISEFDEPGYIYMFWLTPATLSTPSEAASTLLETPPKSRPDPGRRRTSDVLQSFSNSPNARKMILLKIGRASNVQRRLNEWNRQCGYKLSLIRYYPYHSTSPGSAPTSPRKVPHAHKVERLIHLELAGRRAQESGKCLQCGREHREWFEVEAHKAGVKVVDEIIRRWVDWDLWAG